MSGMQETYDSLPLPHTLWGRRTVARLEPSGLRRVLDAGCGTGRDTELLLDLIPEVGVVAVDGSQSMLDQLARRMADRLEQSRSSTRTSRNRCRCRAARRRDHQRRSVPLDRRSRHALPQSRGRAPRRMASSLLIAVGRATSRASWPRSRTCSVDRPRSGTSPAPRRPNDVSRTRASPRSRLRSGPTRPGWRQARSSRATSQLSYSAPTWNACLNRSDPPSCEQSWTGFPSRWWTMFDWKCARGRYERR